MALIPRIFTVIFLTLYSFTGRVLYVFFGRYPVSIFANMKESWIDFLFFYPKVGYKKIWKKSFWFGKELERCFDEEKKKDIDFYPYKTLYLLDKKIYTKIALWELFSLVAMFYLYYFCCNFFVFNLQIVNLDDFFFYFFVLFLCSFILSALISLVLLFTLSSLKEKEEIKEKEIEKIDKFPKIALISIIAVFSVLPLIFFLIIHIPEIKVSLHIGSFGRFILWLISVVGLIIIFRRDIKIYFKKKMDKIKKVKLLNKQEKTKIKESILKIEEETRQRKYNEWLESSFDLKSLPKLVNLDEMPKPSGQVHRFRIKFWQLKAKVCRPFAK